MPSTRKISWASPTGSDRDAASMMPWMRWWVGLMGKKVNWVLDADIQGFFDTINHGWLDGNLSSTVLPTVGYFG